MPRNEVIYYGADSGDTYFWQWVGDDPSGPRIHVPGAADLTAALAELDAAIPVAGAGESSEGMMNRVLRSGAFTSYDREFSLARKVSAVLLPGDLVQEVVDRFEASGHQPVTFRVLPSPRCGRIPWELLAVHVAPETHPDARLIDYADIIADPPPGIYAGRARNPREWSEDMASDPVVYVVDPLTQVLGSVLGDPRQREAFNERIRLQGQDSPLSGAYLDRRDLSRMLRAPSEPSRLFFFGHVASSDDVPGATSLVLSDPPEMFGVTSLIEGQIHADSVWGQNRPFSAFDALEGTLRRDERAPKLLEESNLPELEWPSTHGQVESGTDIWPMPPRVALIACNSGGDLGHVEPFGLVVAFVNSGAGLITATRWTLPTDYALHTVGDLEPSQTALMDMALTVDEAHSHPSPERDITKWQRQQLHRWRSPERSLADSPLLWAALTTYLAPVREVTDLDPDELPG
jgi:hypothetical protein